MPDVTPFDYIERRIAEERERMEREVASAIADGIRTALAGQRAKAQRNDSGGGSASANISMTYGTVVAPIDEGSAYFLLDGPSQEPVAVSTLGLVEVGARFAVFHTPPSGIVVLGGGGGGTIVVDGGSHDPGVHIPTGALDRWLTAARPPLTTLYLKLTDDATAVWPVDTKQFPAPDWTRFAPRQRQDGSDVWPTIFPVWIDDEMMAVTNGVGFVRLTADNPGLAAGTFDLSTDDFVGTGTFAVPDTFKTGGTGVIYADSLGSKLPTGGVLFIHASYYNQVILTYTGTAGDGSTGDPFRFTGCTHQQTVTLHGTASAKPEIGSEVTAPWTVVRGVGGTTATSHTAGTVVRGIDRADVICIGDSITVPFGGDESYILGIVGPTDLRQRLTLPTRVEGWEEQLARALGSGGAGFRSLVSEEWILSTVTNVPGPLGGWLDAARDDNLLVVGDQSTEGPLDLWPFRGTFATFIGPQSHYALVGAGKNHTAKWVPPTPFTGIVEVVYAEYFLSHGLSYQINGTGGWHDIPAEAPTFPRLARYPISCKFVTSVTFRCAKGDGTATNATLAGVIPHDDGAPMLVHNLARGGSSLADVARPQVTTVGYDGESDPFRMLNGDPQSIYPKLVVAEFSNDLNHIHSLGSVDAALTEWVASWTTFVERVGPNSDIVAVLVSNQDRTAVDAAIDDDAQQRFRDEAKTYLLANGVVVLDLQEAWEADYTTDGTTPATTVDDFYALGLLGDDAIKLHPTAKGYKDIASRLIRMLALGGGGSSGVGAVLSPDVLAQFSSSGIVTPTRTSKIWTTVAAGSIGAVIMTMATKPIGTDRSCVIDVRLDRNDGNGAVSIFPTLADRPTYTNLSGNPHIHQLDAAVAFEAGALITCYVVDGGSGRDLEVLIVERASGGVGDIVGPPPSGQEAKWGTFKWGDGTKWGG